MSDGNFEIKTFKAIPKKPIDKRIVRLIAYEKRFNKYI